MSIAKKIPEEAPLYMRLWQQKEKFPICTIRRHKQKQINVEIAVLPIIFVP